MVEQAEPSKFAIHEAARDGRTQVVESLLAANPKLAQRVDDDGRLPLHWAVSYNHLDIAKLLAATKDFDADVQDGSGWTPLMIAVSLKDGEELVDLLLRKDADVNAKNFTGQVRPPSPIPKQHPIPSQLVQSFPVLIPHQQTALHFVSSKKNIDLARRLLDHKPPASARVKDKRGQYAIHRAAAVGSVPIVELLIKNKSPLNASDVAGQTPLHHAVAEGHGDTAVALLKAGADTEKKDNDGFLALDLAPDSQVKKYILKTAEMEGIEI
ncbi:ankyrin repeat-containing domain protein [Leptodontidium sp. 2 PMI_412]|nr:ankyrin repeat-containing domain protein [Leptodontidium sp. MPI-SDFR-AT-0119]KAH9206858.1 ankyrin repeat-containing domain protein [Leptodontidium sp. 2 PMI_412]